MSASDEVWRRLSRDGAEIAYGLRRSGAPRRTLVLLHGLASNSSRWSEFAGTTALTHSWDLLRLDLRGQGGSVFRGRAGMDEWCGDLAAILEAENCGPALLIGHCLGANLALRFAAREPRRVAGLVLIEPMLRRALRGGLRRTLLLRPLVLLAALLVRALNALGLYRRHLATVDLEALDRRTRAAGAEALKEYASPLADLRSMPLAAYLQGLAAVTDAQPDLSALKLPVLVLMAEHSGFTDPVRTRELLAVLPECEIQQLPALHWIPTETPEAMRAAIEDWAARRF